MTDPDVTFKVQTTFLHVAISDFTVKCHYLYNNYLFDQIICLFKCLSRSTLHMSSVENCALSTQTTPALGLSFCWAPLYFKAQRNLRFMLHYKEERATAGCLSYTLLTVRLQL